MSPEVTIVIPVFNEAENIAVALEKIEQEVMCPHIVNIVYDFDEDSTIPVVERERPKYSTEINLIKNKYAKGVLNAIKTGLVTSKTEFVIVTMADLSDPPQVINDMLRVAKVENADIVCGSRYMKGGTQVGGPLVKGLMSRCAGLSLHYMTGLPTHDATNSFKLYRKSFLEKMQIESTGGFELGIELVAKAFVGGYKICEVPTSWYDRVGGESNFKLFSWLPSYLRWYFYTFNRKLTEDKTLFTEKQINIFSWIFLGLVVFLNLFFILKGTVNLPYMDEWELVGHLGKFDFSWLFTHHNEHQIVFTKLLAFVLAKIGGWNLYANVAISYFVYIFMVGVLYKIVSPIVKNFAALPLFFVPLFSTINFDNFANSFQSQFHFMILFGLLAVVYGFLKEKTFHNTLLFSLFLVCSFFSMNFAFALGILFVYLVKEKSRLRLILPSVVIFSALCSFFIGYQKYTAGTVLTFPWQLNFWEFGLNLFSYSVTGWNFPLIAEILISIGVIYSLLNFLLKKENCENKNLLALLAIVLASCFSLGAISIGRGGGEIVASSRHVEVIVILIPVISSLLYLNKNRRAKNWLFLYTVILLFGFLPKLNFQIYTNGELHLMKVAGESCVKDFYTAKKSSYCWSIYPGDINDRLIEAKRINLSFTRDFEAVKK